MKRALAHLVIAAGIILSVEAVAERTRPRGGEPGSPAGRGSTTRPAGLSGKYPGDAGIGSDPAVILHEDFEADAIDRKRWPNVSDKAGALKLVRPSTRGHGGRQALQITATLGTNTGGHLFRRFATGYERMHARFRVRFDENCDYIHHFVHMVAQLPPTSWPTGGAGLRPAGDKKFSIGIEPWGRWGRYPRPGGWHFYSYWWKMPRSRDGKYWGQGHAEEAYAVPARGQWTCVEFMVQCNTPGEDDGEVALWIDGTRRAHHKGINWRSSADLKLNAFWLMLYVTDHSAKTHKVNTVWFDDVVVATEYIGPPQPASRPARNAEGRP